MVFIQIIPLLSIASHLLLFDLIQVLLIPWYYLVSINLKNQISSSLEFDHNVVCQPLTISSDSDCNKLLQNGWKSITVNEGLCNSMTNNLVLSYNPCLQSILVKKNSLKNLNSLVISNNSKLESIVIEDGQGWNSQSQSYNAPFENVKSVEISSIFYLMFI